ncbi:tyrosine-type recombinase/integrase [Variovorax atrisoli]|uniref:tyrosine-type recombinase/integrase n=1 Tax=Variovorax atrisoli TaxID=3394203 RepID=UPI003391C763
MHLISATADFVLAGMPCAGFPIVLWEDMRSCCEVNEFLRHYLSRASIESPKSWPLTGRALYDYFSFLETHQLVWTDVSRNNASLVAAYRKYCLDTIRLARNTVRQRIRYVCAFYEYALRQGWVSNLPFDYETRRIIRAPGFLAHVAADGGQKATPSVMPRAHRGIIKFLSREEVSALLKAATNPHHYMIIRFALRSGLRREELASFPLAYVLDPSKLPGTSQNLRVTLDPGDGSGMKTKGSRKRVIVIRREMMQELFRYAKHWRGERASLTGTEQKPVFLNQDGQPWSADGKGIEAMVRGVGKRAGLRVHPHMLRHTYATHTLVALQRQRKIEPLVFLQKQLGHASINTTMVYLHLLNELVDDAVLEYDDELNEWLGD